MCAPASSPGILTNMLSTITEREQDFASRENRFVTKRPKISEAGLTKKEIKLWHIQTKADFKEACKTNGDILEESFRLKVHLDLGTVPDGISEESSANSPEDTEESERKRLELLFIRRKIEEIKIEAQRYERENILPALSNPQSQCVRFMNARMSVLPGFRKWQDFYTMRNEFESEKMAYLVDFFVCRTIRNQFWHYNRHVHRMVTRGRNDTRIARALLTNENAPGTWRDSVKGLFSKKK